MRLDAKSWVGSPGDVVPAAREAERLGFSGLWVSEVRHDPYLLLAAAATHTRRLELGTAIALAYPRSPMVTAHAARDLQGLAGGRFILGLGSQVRAHIERRYSTTWEAPAGRMKEYVRALHTIWRSWQQETPLEHRGRFYRFDLMSPQWSPGPSDQPRVPVYVAAVGPGMSRVAGEVADGVHVHPMHTVRYVREGVLPALRQGAARARREPGEIGRATMAFVITGRSPGEWRESRRTAREGIAFYASTPAYRDAVLARHGWEEVGRRLSQLAREGRWGEMERLVPEEMEREVATTGEWDEIGPMLLQRYRGLLDRVALYVDFRPGERDEFWRTVLRSAQGDP